MNFLSAGKLWLLLLVAALLVGYVVATLRRRMYTTRLSTAPLLASVAPRRPQWWRRHVPAFLLLLTLATMVTALARPARSERVPRERATIVLAIDVSNSMAATDVSPTRLEAAKLGALAFVEQIPPKVNLGLVSFAGTASVLVSPSTNRDDVRASIRTLRLAPATAIGEGIFAGLQAITSVADRLESQGQGPPPGAIILLSDGETTRGRPNDEATVAAQRARVAVSTIAYGTPNGTLTVGGQEVPVPVNEDALREISQQTNGSFHRATTGDELRSVYRGLGSSVGYRTEYREVTGWFVGLALGLGLGAGALSVLFSSRLP